MMKGVALLVGLTSVNPSTHGHWNGTDGCWGCELDVDNMGRILQPLGYDIKKLKTADATRPAILSSLGQIGKSLECGDIFVFYFSGHGGQQLDANGDELDGHDETLVAYDLDIIDDDLNTHWLRFEEGVRVVMISDSCNSGTNYKGLRDIHTLASLRPIEEKLAKAMKAQLIHFGGCRDGFRSRGQEDGGVFTKALSTAWDQGNFEGNYPDFYNAIRNLVTSEQRPQYNKYCVTAEFESQKPFTTISPMAVALIEIRAIRQP